MRGRACLAPGCQRGGKERGRRYDVTDGWIDAYMRSIEQGSEAATVTLRSAAKTDSTAVATGRKSIAVEGNMPTLTVLRDLRVVGSMKK